MSSCASFALYIGVTLASLSICGTYPVSSDLLNRVLRGVHI